MLNKHDFIFIYLFLYYANQFYPITKNVHQIHTPLSPKLVKLKKRTAQIYKICNLPQFIEFLSIVVPSRLESSLCIFVIDSKIKTNESCESTFEISKYPQYRNYLFKSVPIIPVKVVIYLNVYI